MNFVIALIIAFLFNYPLSKIIKKYPYIFYILAIAISIVTFSVNFENPILKYIFSTLFQYGTFSTALFTIIMYMNAFKNGNFFQKRLMPIRGELSIIACLFAFGHNIFTGKTYFYILFTNPQSLDTLVLIGAITSLVLICIMIPLFITSFKCVRKKMSPKSWKKLQSLAYPFYMLIYIHIIMLNMPKIITKNSGAIVNIIVFSIVFIGYATLRILKNYHKKNDKKYLAYLIGVYCVVLVAFISSFTISHNSKTTNNNSSSSQIDKFASIDFSNYADGEYLGEGQGYNGTVYVTVVIQDKKLVNFTVDKHTDTENYMEDAKWIKLDIIEKQSLDVDVISGATKSSNGIKNAIYDALCEK